MDTHDFDQLITGGEGVMILHHYSPIPQSYYHSGRGLGSVFARLFSKIAAKTAGKVATAAAKNAGKKLVKVVTTKGMQIGRKALNTAAKEGVKAVRQYGPEALKKVGKVASEFALQKIDSASHKAIKHGAPVEVVHSLSNAAKTGLNKTGNKVVSAVTKEVGTLLNQVSAPTGKNSPRAAPSKKNLSKLAGVKRKGPRVSHQQEFVKYD